MSAVPERVPRMSIAIKEDMHKVLREVEQAVAAAQRDDWSRVERSLVEALGGIGTVLREIGLGSKAKETAPT